MAQQSVCVSIFAAGQGRSLSAERAGSGCKHFPSEEEGSGLTGVVGDRKHS